MAKTRSAHKRFQSCKAFHGMRSTGRGHFGGSFYPSRAFYKYAKAMFAATLLGGLR